MTNEEIIKYLKNNIKKDMFEFLRRRIPRPDGSGIKSNGWILRKDKTELKSSLNIEELKKGIDK